MRAINPAGQSIPQTSRRPPEMLMQQAQAIDPSVVPRTRQDAIASDTIFLAVPLWELREVAKQITTWQGKTITDATNTNAPVEDPDGQPSSAFVAKALTGARFVKGFNHLPAAFLDGGSLVQARSNTWGKLIFKDLVKFK